MLRLLMNHLRTNDEAALSYLTKLSLKPAFSPPSIRKTALFRTFFVAYSSRLPYDDADGDLDPDEGARWLVPTTVIPLRKFPVGGR